MRPVLWWLTIVLFSFATKPASAFVELSDDDGEYTLDITGSARITGAYLHYPNIENSPWQDDGISAGVGRLMLEGYLGEHVNYEFNGYFDLSHTPSLMVNGDFNTAGAFATPYRTKYLAWKFWDNGNVNGKLGVDRFNFHFVFEPVDITIGRFPINHSVTYIFTPNDFFAPFSVNAINTIYKPGVDAGRISLATGNFSSIELVGVLGNNSDHVPAWSKTALLMRMSTVLWNYEWAMLGGKLADRWIVGASFQGEVGSFGLRGEGHVGFIDFNSDGTLDDNNNGLAYSKINGKFALGFDKVFEWRNVSIGTEYQFISGGAGSPSGYAKRAALFLADDQPYLGQHYVGLMTGLDLIPILRANLTFLFNALDYSGLGSFTLVYNIADEADFVGGLMVPWGKRPGVDTSVEPMQVSIESEYGFQATTAFLETRFYF